MTISIWLGGEFASSEKLTSSSSQDTMMVSGVSMPGHALKKSLVRAKTEPFHTACTQYSPAAGKLQFWIWNLRDSHANVEVWRKGVPGKH